MQITLERITPAMALELLQKNQNNRAMRSKHVMKLARAIEQGEWMPTNPAPIVINGDQLLDGQHRLAAIVEANKPVKMWIARGAPTAVMATMDTGLARSLKDTLVMAKEPYAALAGGVLRQIWTYREEGRFGSPRESPSHAELMALLEQPRVREVILGVGHDYFKSGAVRIGSPTLIGAAWYVLGEIDVDDATEFIRRLMDGADLSLGDPILQLRELFLARTRPRSTMLGACLIKAWNLWRSGETVPKLRWEPQKETYPEPI